MLVRKSHSLTVLSTLPLKNVSLAGFTAIASTLPVWPLKYLRYELSWSDQYRSVSSLEETTQ